MPLPTRVITLKEHAAFPSLGHGSTTPFYQAMWKVFPEWKQDLSDHATKRIADMDSGHISFQVMSHIPGIGSTNPLGCTAANNEMAAAIKQNPTRLGGFAVLPMAHPEEAATELERAVKELGLLGALIDNHLEDMTHYDDEKFWPVFAIAEKLDVPIFLHPSPSSPEIFQQGFMGNYPMQVAFGLSTAAWGWNENVGLHVLKLYAAGLFDRFPRLKIVIGHMGEMMPFMLDRIERMPFLKVGGGEARVSARKSLKAVWDEDIWVTTSGMFSLNPMATLLKTTKIERILYSVDYPFENNEHGRKFIEELEKSDAVTQEELAMIAHGNAANLLKLD
ncbi:amidohydrolase 2 [Stipitochalara longipes BDJ]|nr:amidohydrolase 2 [Stipitochalara longipes BDJ]